LWGSDCLDKNEEVLLLKKWRTIAFKACCKENILVILEFVFKTFIINVGISCNVQMTVTDWLTLSKKSNLLKVIVL